MRFPKLSPLLLIVLGGLLLRLAWLLVARPVPLSDYGEYKKLGEALLDYHQFGYPEPRAVRLPGYPAFLALLMLARRSVFWLSLCNVLLSTGLIVLLYQLARHLSRGDQRYAHTCALVCALYPGFVFYSPVLASEHLFALIYFGGLLLLLRGGIAGAPPLGTTILAGLLLGVATVTRGEGLFYLPAYFLVIFFSRGTVRARAMRGGLIVLCIALVTAPWYVRNRQLFGPGIGLAAGSGLVFYFSHNRYEYGYSDAYYNPELMAPTLEESAKLGWKAGLEYLREDPGHVLRRMPLAFSKQYAPGEIPYPMFWGTIKSQKAKPGGWVSERREIPGLERLDDLCRLGYQLILILTPLSFVFWRTLPGSSWALLWTVILGNWFGYCVVFWATDRYRFTAEIAACMLAAVTISGLVRQARRRLPIPALIGKGP